MKSATRSRPTSGFPDDDGFGDMWTDSSFPPIDADPWTDPNAVAQAWPQQQKQREEPINWSTSKKNKRNNDIEWTATDSSGFPSDPFVPDAWPEPTQEQEPQRMSDEDWLPATRHANVSSQVGDTWGTAAQGRSDESDDWNTDPLSFSQDGLSGHALGQPPLGTESRPIAVEDLAVEEEVLEEREADLLKQAEKKRQSSPLARQKPRRNSPSKARSPNAEEDFQGVSPRKGIMRFFGGGVSGKVLRLLSVLGLLYLSLTIYHDSWEFSRGRRKRKAEVMQAQLQLALRGYLVSGHLVGLLRKKLQREMIHQNRQLKLRKLRHKFHRA